MRRMLSLGLCYNKLMWIRNPLSSKRLKWLSQYLQRKLQSSGQLVLFHTYLERLPLLGEADPTRSGQYCTWILDLLLKKNIDLPEDAQKLRELLSVYHRVKSKLPIEFRQIHHFKTYSELRITLLPMLPSLRSNAELIREGSVLMGTERLGGNLYQIYQITTPEAASEIAKNTGWCVCNIGNARGYLEEGPLYLILKNDTRYALAHLESHQLMDINDDPILPKKNQVFGPETDDYFALVALFKKHLPQFLCQKPLKDAPLFPHGLIKNLECHTYANMHAPTQENRSEMYGCPECGFIMCPGERGETCNNICCPDHSFKCFECDEIFCNDHIQECKCHPSKSWCRSHSQQCRVCGENVCGECSTFCQPCDASVCNKCSETCDFCSTTYCESHAEMATCHECDNEVCRKCQDKGKGLHCYNCDNFTCSECTQPCKECNSEMCLRCSIECPICKRQVCLECSDYCSGHCNETYCRDCSSNICDLCDKHDSELQSCEVCSKQELCSQCSFECQICNKIVCLDKIIKCQCREPHFYCPECAQQQLCFCGKIICDPEDHFLCSYITRWRS